MATYWLSVGNGASFVEFAADGTPSLISAAATAGEPPCGLALAPRPLALPYAPWVATASLGFLFPSSSDPAVAATPFNLCLEASGALLTVTPTDAAGGTVFGTTSSSALAAVFLRASDLLLAGGVPGGAAPSGWYNSDALVLLSVVNAGVGLSASVPFLLVAGAPTFTPSAPTPVMGVSVVSVAPGAPQPFAAVLPLGYAIGADACGAPGATPSSPAVVPPSPCAQSRPEASWAASAKAWCPGGAPAFAWGNTYAFTTGAATIAGSNIASPITSAYFALAVPATALVLGAAPFGTSLSCTAPPPVVQPLTWVLAPLLYAVTAIVCVALLLWGTHPLWRRHPGAPPAALRSILAWNYDPADGVV